MVRDQAPSREILNDVRLSPNTPYPSTPPLRTNEREISESEVQRFIIDKVKSGLEKKTVRDIIAVLRAIIKYGARNKLFEREDWQLNYPTEEGGYRLPVLSLRHQRTLMMYLIENPNSRNIGILRALCTGMRIGEVCTLQWTDVDLSHRILRVHKTAGRIYNYDKEYRTYSLYP